MPADIVPKNAGENQLKLSNYSFFFSIDAAKGIFAPGRWGGRRVGKGFNRRHVRM